MKTRAILLTATLGSLALAGCVDPYAYPNDPNGRTKTGAITGAIIGGVLGANTNGGNKFASTAVGAATGAAIGGLIGHTLDQQAADLRASLGDGRIQIINEGSYLRVVMPQDILFATDSTAVNADLTRELGIVAQNLLHYPDSRIEVVGHTDNTGTASYNQDLSQRRAAAVASILRDDGVPSARIIAYGRGEDMPVTTNLTPEGRAQNRRVEILIRPNA